MNNIKVLSPSTTFGNIKVDLSTNKVLSVNKVLNNFLIANDIKPLEFVKDIRSIISGDSAHISLGGLEFIVCIDILGNVLNLSTHQVSSLKKDSKTTLPMDELHKRRLMSIGEMTSGIIHDINNPLNIVSSGVELLDFFIEDIENVPEKELSKIKDQINKVKIGVNRISEISEGVRMLMRKDQINFKKQSISKIITSSSSCCISFLRENGIEFNLKVQDSLNDIVISCKESLLAQVFVNLIKNSNDAIKELPPHNKYIEFDLNETNTHVIIKVKDGGKGIPKEIHEKIFEPFFTTKDMGEGTGIGLSLCRQIAEAHGGWLKIDDKAVNTTFEIALSKNLKF